MPAITPGFGSLQSFELAVRQAKLLSSSTLVPAQYRAETVKKGKNGGPDLVEENPNAIPNCVIATNMAQRMGADTLMVMQNLYIVEGRPSWSSQWIIAAVNGCGRFSPLRFKLTDLGERVVEYTVSEWGEQRGQRVNVKKSVTIRDIECVAWVIERETGERLESPKVSIGMAVAEGWYGKNGSKWQTMPELMLRYRTASFFGKLYAPELLMGLQSVEEAQDVFVATRGDDGRFAVEEPAPEAMEPLHVPTPPRTAARRADAAAPGQVVEVVNPTTGEIDRPGPPWFDADAFADRLTSCGDIDALDVLADEIRSIEATADTKDMLADIAARRRAELASPAPAPAPAPAAAQRRRPGGIE